MSNGIFQEIEKALKNTSSKVTDEFLIDNSNFATVVTLTTLHIEDIKERGEGLALDHLSYHFHFLFSEDKENEILYGLCLDVDQIVSRKLKIGTEIANLRDECIRDILNDFFERTIDFYSNEHTITPENYESFFPRSDQAYYEKFNKIKEFSFLRGLFEYYNYISDRGKMSIKSTISEEELQIDKFKREVYEDKRGFIKGYVTEEYDFAK